VLQNSLGSQIWSIDNIAASSTSLLASNNIWSGTQTWNNTATFNGATSFNVGLTSTGPNFLSGGGSLTGTYGGGPIFSGLPNFSGGFLATTGTFSGQITSTVATGTAPFVVASQTQVNNLNASLLEGADWPNPGLIGFTTPNTGKFTTLTVTTGFVLNGAPSGTFMRGTDSMLLSAAVLGASGTPLCVSPNGGATTTGCQKVPLNAQNITYCPAGCTVTGTPCPTSGASYASCTNIINWPVAFADATYSVQCQGVGITNFPYIGGVTKAASSITVTTFNGTSNGAMISSFAEIDCFAATKN
jgi:hypothetical protein